MIETVQEFSFEYFPGSNSFSIHKEIVLKEDGRILGRNRIHSMGFTPTMIEQMKDYLGDENHPLIAYCNTIWTPEVVEAQRLLEAAANGE